MWIIIIPYVIILLFVLSGISFVFRKWKLGLAVLSLALIVNVWTQSIPLRGKSIFKNDESNLVKIMTWNMNSSEIAEDDTLSWKKVIDVIENESPSILMLQEVHISHDCLLKAYLEEHFPYSAEMIRWGDNIIYSRYPLGKVELLKIDTVGSIKPATKEWWLKEARLSNPDVPVNNERLVMSTIVDIGGYMITLINCHLGSNHYDMERRSMPHECPWWKGIPSYLKNIRGGERQRMAEAIAIKEILEDSDSPSLVCGDMNDLNGSKVLNIIQKDCNLEDAWWTGGFGPGFTYHGHSIMHFRLDHILYSKTFKLRGVRVIKQKYSDHQPLVATFSLDPDPEY